MLTSRSTAADAWSTNESNCRMWAESLANNCPAGTAGDACGHEINGGPNSGELGLGVPYFQTTVVSGTSSNDGCRAYIDGLSNVGAATKQTLKLACCA